MTPVSPHFSPHSPHCSPQAGGKSCVCQRCGGSGILRLGDQRYRTCLDCLGQGQLLSDPVETLVFRAFSPSAAASAA